MINVFKKSIKALGALVFTVMIGLAVSLVIPVTDASQESTPVVQAAAKLNTKGITMTKGKTYTIKVSGTKDKVTYKTSNKKIATVSKKGVVKGVAKGKTTIKVKVGKKTYKVSVKVEKPSISKSSLSLKKGNTYKLKVNGTSRKIKWSTNNKSVATVSSNGKVTAKGKGQAVITAKLNDKKYTCKVTVGGYNVIKCPDSVSVKYGETKKFTLTAGDGFSFGCQNSGVASVDINPKYFKVGEKLTMTVTGNSVGTTYVEFKSNAGWTKKCKVTVTGTAVTSSAISNTISNVKVNSVRVYRSANTSNPELNVQSSITNNMNAGISYMNVYYGLYNKSGKLLGTVYDIISNPAKGKTYSLNFRVTKNDDVNIKDIASVKLLFIKGSVSNASYGKTNPNIKASLAANTGNTGISISNIKAKYEFGYYYHEVEAFFSYQLKNNTSQGKTIMVYYDAYDRNGKKIQQEYEEYDSYYIAPGQTVNVPYGSYGKDLSGDLATGTFAKVVLRVVEY